MSRPFKLETLVDFPDDALTAPFPITPAHIDAMIKTLKEADVTRVIWAYYGDGHGGWFFPAGIAGVTEDPSISFDQNQWKWGAATYDELGNPLKVACEAAHRHGIEVYAYFKPYETGPSVVFAEGSPKARQWGRLWQIGGFMTWLDPFVVKNPHLRIARRTDDLWPGHENATIATIKLTKKDDSPTRLKKEHLQMWTSQLNYRYEQKNIDFRFTETVEPSSRDVHDVYNNLVTRKGDPVRVLTLSGLALNDRYILVTTTVTDRGDFANAWDRLLTAYDETGREIPGVYATGTAIWFPEWEDFHTSGLAYDTGRGPEVITLDGSGGSQSDIHFMPGQKKRTGYVAFARGRNSHLPGALCETEPQVRDYWLSCVQECLDAGVDGVEFRCENHSTHTDFPHEYGFNDAVMQQVRDRTSLAEIAQVRGRAYTEFLKRANALIHARGKKMRVNLNVDWYREPHDRPGSRKLAFSANINFNWREWIEMGLLDEATLRPFAKNWVKENGEDDPVAAEMLSICKKRGIPVTLNRYVWANTGLLDEFRKVRADDRFAGFILYETWSYMLALQEGGWVIGGDKQPPTSKDSPDMWARRAETAGYVKRVIDEWKRTR